MTTEIDQQIEFFLQTLLLQRACFIVIIFMGNFLFLFIHLLTLQVYLMRRHHKLKLPVIHLKIGSKNTYLQMRKSTLMRLIYGQLGALCYTHLHLNLIFPMQVQQKNFIIMLAQMILSKQPPSLSK